MGKENYVANGSGVGEQHGETVDANAFTSRRRHTVAESADIIFVHRVCLLIAPVSLRHLQLKAPLLFFGIVELAVSIGNLHATHVDLETLDEGRVARFGLAERRK